MRTLQSELFMKRLSQTPIQEIEKEDIKTSKHPKEMLSRREWLEIMGCNRDTYSRGKGGAIRRR
ncbi:hypothetical protein [Paenisporosarcina sp. TG-14]|uniref:hypothetical protein n=1 Tax=Paenisporosarcina sp. TG-14 TaxID=1231057 RepID=UPI00030DA7B8|nr:hypothetical protein [Paenisporosarcina sp. TG-14]